MLKAAFDWFVSVGDAASQLVGRFLFVRVEHEWQAWTMSPNESISGAAHRWTLRGEFTWVEKALDGLFFFDPGHCEAAYRADYQRALNYVYEYEL